MPLTSQTRERQTQQGLPGCLGQDVRPVRYTVVPSPIEPILLSGDGDTLTGLFMSPIDGELVIGEGWRRDPGCFSPVAAQLEAYFAGDLTEFDVPLRLTGTPFQRGVWEGLQTIAYGQTTSYGELARRLGNAKASRAVGLANGRNPISIIVPCHRVIGASGRLIGYAGGMARKQFLLELEGHAGRLW